MNHLNSVIIEGDLVQDPELSYTAMRGSVCKLRISCSRFFKIDTEYQKEVSFFEITVRDKQAEVCSKHLKKGRGIRVVGRLKEERWQNVNGAHSRVFIVAEHVEFKPARSPLRSENKVRALDAEALGLSDT